MLQAHIAISWWDKERPVSAHPRNAQNSKPAILQARRPIAPDSPSQPASIGPSAKWPGLIEGRQFVWLGRGDKPPAWGDRDQVPAESSLVAPLLCLARRAPLIGASRPSRVLRVDAHASGSCEQSPNCRGNSPIGGVVDPLGTGKVPGTIMILPVSSPK